MLTSAPHMVHTHPAFVIRCEQEWVSVRLPCCAAPAVCWTTKHLEVEHCCESPVDRARELHALLNRRPRGPQ